MPSYEEPMNVYIQRKSGVMFLRGVIHIAHFPDGAQGFYFSNGSTPEIVNDVEHVITHLNWLVTDWA